MRVLLTGASGTMGGLIATAIHRANHAVVTIGRQPPISVQQVEHLGVDLAGPGDVDRACQHLANGHGRLVDAAVLAAGVDSHQGIHNIDLPAFTRAMQVNCLAPLRLISGLLAARPKGRDPLRVCVLSSDVVGRPAAQSAVYAASKAALEEGLRHATADSQLLLLLVRLPYIGVPMRELAEGGGNRPQHDPPKGAMLGNTIAKIMHFIDNGTTTGSSIEVWP